MLYRKPIEGLTMPRLFDNTTKSHDVEIAKSLLESMQGSKTVVIDTQEEKAVIAKALSMFLEAV